MAGEGFDFGGLRSVLQAEPSEQVWDALCERVFPTRYEAHAPLWLPYASDHLDRRWPDALRVWPLRWMSNKRSSAAQLVRVARLHDPSKKQIEQLARQMEVQQAPLRRIELRIRPNGVEDQRIKTLLDAAPQTLREVALDMVWLHEQERWRGLSDHAAMQRIEVIELSSCAVPTEGIIALLRASRVLRELRVSDHYAPLDCAQLARQIKGCAALETLETLRLEGYGARGEEVLDALPWVRLRRLEVVDTR